MAARYSVTVDLTLVISLPPEIVHRMEKEMRLEGFETLEQFARGIIINRYASEEPQKNYSDEDREAIKQRLKRLGYIG